MTREQEIAIAKFEEFEKLHYGFKEAYENLIDGHQSIAKFADDLHAVGFSRCWPLNDKERNAVYSAIYSRIEDLMGKVLDKNEMKSVAHNLLDFIVKEYNNWII